MTSPRFKLRLLRACRLGDELRVAGAVVEVDANRAHELVREQCAVLCDEARLPELLDLVLMNGHRPGARQ